MIAFIVNPIAGNGKAYKMIPKIKKIMRDFTKDYKIYVTRYPGEGCDIAKFVSKNGYDRIVAVGGDGTVHEVINGIKDTNMILGIIPLGTGNDFARFFHIPKNVKKAIQVIINGKVNIIDSALINKYITCNNVANIGIDADVALEVTKFKKYLSGIFAYLLSLFDVLFKFKPYNVNINIDGKRLKRKIMLAAFGTCSFYGGGFKILPNANPKDGLMDIIIVNSINKFKLLFLLPMAIIGRHTRFKCVETYKAKEVHIEIEREIALCIDGEVIPSSNFELNVQKSTIKLCTN